jgi:hypothetical protein
METIVPLSSYRLDETGYWKRLPLVSGLLFGLAMGTFVAIFPSDASALFYSRMVRILISLIGGGALFGFLFPFFFRRKVNRIIDALHAGKSWIDAPPPANRNLAYRFPCTLLVSGRGIGGVMYLGQRELIFVSHKLNGRHKQQLEWEPLSGLRIAAIDSPSLRGLRRILVPHPQPLMEVRWSGGTATFVVPTAKTTAARLSGLIEKMRSEERGGC